MRGKQETIPATVDTIPKPDGSWIYRLTHPDHPEITVEGENIKQLKRAFVAKVRQALKKNS